MKNLTNFINETYINEASVEDKTFKGIPVKELYKSLINGIKQWGKDYGHPDYEDLDAEKTTPKGLVYLASHIKIDDIPQYEIKNKKFDYSQTIEAITELFKENWDNGTADALREVSRDTYGSRYYKWTIKIGDHKLVTHTGCGPMKELNKYKEK